MIEHECIEERGGGGGGQDRPTSARSDASHRCRKNVHHCHHHASEEDVGRQEQDEEAAAVSYPQSVCLCHPPVKGFRKGRYACSASSNHHCLPNKASNHRDCCRTSICKLFANLYLCEALLLISACEYRQYSTSDGHSRARRADFCARLIPLPQACGQSENCIGPRCFEHEVDFCNIHTCKTALAVDLMPLLPM